MGGVYLGFWGVGWLPLFGFLGALLVSVLVYGLAWWQRFSISGFILGGVVISFICTSLVIFLLSWLPLSASQWLFFLLVGDLSGVDIRLLPWVVLVVLGGVLLLLGLGRSVEVLALGREKAYSLGVEVGWLMPLVFWITAWIAGSCVSAAGLIGFVGMMVPHIGRLCVGGNLERLLPFSIWLGGIFLMLADTLSRVIFYPRQVPVGAITGLLGGIFFLVLLFGRDREV
ncbi:MAG: iron ABC transporter permease [Planctomycetota bacterium]|nr:MAG: iron ABC transporter permease [Planctomycetota bacterium]